MYTLAFYVYDNLVCVISDVPPIVTYYAYLTVQYLYISSMKTAEDWKCAAHANFACCGQDIWNGMGGGRLARASWRALDWNWGYRMCISNPSRHFYLDIGFTDRISSISIKSAKMSRSQFWGVQSSQVWSQCKWAIVETGFIHTEYQFKFRFNKLKLYHKTTLSHRTMLWLAYNLSRCEFVRYLYRTGRGFFYRLLAIQKVDNGDLQILQTSKLELERF